MLPEEDLVLDSIGVSAVFSKRVIMAESRAFFVDCCLVKRLIVFCDVSGLCGTGGSFPHFVWGMESIFFPSWR